LRIGNLTVPDDPYRLPTLLLDVAKIYRTYPRAVRKAYENDDLARLLGYASSRNGAYWNRLSALKHYGLVEGRPHLALSDLARRITTAQDEVERSGAYFEAVTKIVLWLELYRRHKFNLPEHDLWEEIVEITECSPNVARDVEPYVRRAFEEDTNSVKNFNFQAPSGHLWVEVRSADNEIRSEDKEMVIEIKAGPYYYQLPFTQEGLKLAIEMLRMIKVPEEKAVEQSKAT
jgi:hypothetical protein